MTTQAIIQANRRLVSNMSPIGLGTIIKAWRGSKGLDYIVVGINTQTRQIYAIKHNCINEDGKVHAAVTRHKRVFSYSVLSSGQYGIVTKAITTVIGQKATLDFDAVQALNHSVDPNISLTGFNTISLHTPCLVDRRKSSVYA